MYKASLTKSHKLLSVLCALLAVFFTFQAAQAAWITLVTVDSSAAVGQYCSLAEVNSRPAISFYDADNGSLLYQRSTDANGATWGAATVVDTTGDVGQFTSLAIIGGNPAISYVDFTTGYLYFIRASNADGTAWGTRVLVDNGSFNGNGVNAQYTSLAEVNGVPAIAYFDAQSGGELRYVYASNAAGSAWNTPQILESILPGMTGMYPSLKVINLNPAIAFYDVTNGDLKYKRASDAAGSAWNATVTVASTGDVGTSPSLFVVNGNPAISYQNGTTGNLNYVRATGPSGILWAAPVVADPGTATYLYTSMIVTGSNPAIAYMDPGGDLKYVRADNADGTAWTAAGPHVLDAGGVGEYTSMALINGNPAVAYYDGANFTLKYTRAGDPTAVTLGGFQARSQPAAVWGALALLALGGCLLLRLRKA